MPNPVRKRSVVIAGHRTSVSLEDAFWQILMTIARRRHKSLNALIEEIDRDRDGSNLSSAIRLFVLDDLQGQVALATQAGPPLTFNVAPPCHP